MYKEKEVRLKDINSGSCQSSPVKARSSLMIQADDFLAILIYVVIKSGFYDIIPCLEMVSAFTLNKRQQPFEYMRASLEGSIQFILYEIDHHIPRENSNFSSIEKKKESS